MKKIMTILLCIFILQGCAPAPQSIEEPAVRPLVTMITATLDGAQGGSPRRYSQEKKMGYILTVLRLLQREGLPADPTAQALQITQITLHLADGTRRNYFLRDGAYLSKGGESWLRIEPSRGALLEKLVMELPQDP